MKQTTFTLLFAVLAFMSCRKNKYDPTIIQYDDDQIKAYISKNGITGMLRDTSGIYYQIIDQGRTTGKDSVIQYSTPISMVFTVQSLDGKYVSADTIANHFADFAGHMVGTPTPLGISVPGLQSAIHDILKHPNGKMRIIIPSRLAYGVAGAGTGSSSVAGRIAGNQCLDYYVHLIDDQNAYDQTSIKQYIASHNLTNMHQDSSGLWYSIHTPGTGTVPITYNSTVFVTYTVSLFNGTISDQYNTAGGTGFDIPDVIKGVQIGLSKYATAGSLMTLIIPSSLGYGSTATGIPKNSCIIYDVEVDSVSP